MVRLSEDYRKDIPILSDSKANNPPPKQSWIFIAYADNDVDGAAKAFLDNISLKIRSRHSPQNYTFLGDGCYAEPTYQCLLCESKDMYVNYQANRIQCNSCGKKWNVKEWLADLDHLILEFNPGAKDLIDEINKVENRK